ncbi:MAG: GvpL/GvpF family gas vesicle protein [Myxococcota bacterium]
MTLLCAYAAIDAVPAHGLGAGAHGEPLEALAVEDFFVVVGRLAETPGITPENLKAQDAAVRRLHAAVQALLPMRFGETFSGVTELRAALQDRVESLRAALLLVRGCEQMTLRVFGQAAEPEPVPDEKTERPGTRYLRARAHALTPPQLSGLQQALAPLVHATRVDRHQAPGLLASVYHLVRRGDGPRYQAVVDGLAPALHPLRVVCSGVWPAYAFAPEVAE